jgi:transcription initiation factor TFIID subunit 13
VVPRPILRKGEEEVDEQELEKGGGGGGGGGGKKMTAKMKAKEKAEKQAEKDGDEQEYDARGGMGAKRKRGMFARDLRYMMYGFGDVRDPNNETVALVEDLMVDFITNVAHQAMECAERRGGRFSNEDLLYVIRNDEKKLRRVEELMEMNEYLKEARKNFDLADPNVVEKTAEEKEE